MATTSYEYSVSADFPNQKVDASRLTQEIRESSITTALGGVLVSGDVCTITFKDALSAGDKTVLDGIVAAHTGIPLTPKLPIQPVKDIDVADLDPDYARTKVKGMNFDCVADEWTKDTISWPYHVNVLNGEAYAGFAESGDKAEMRVAPQIVGGVGADASQGATEIVVDNGIKALFANKTIFPGMYFKFERNPQGAPSGPDNPDPQSDEYEIASFDPDTNTATIVTELETAVSTGDYVYLMVKYAETLEIQQNEKIDIGGAANGAAPVPAGVVFEVWYHAVSTKRVNLRLNLKYGPLAED